MSIRKADLRLAPRTPAFVSREGGAAELMISPETWDRWVAEGILPPPVPGCPASTPRWRWADVDATLARPAQEATTDPFLAGVEFLRNGAQARRKPRSA
jgi:hypothetical protein